MVFEDAPYAEGLGMCALLPLNLILLAPDIVEAILDGWLTGGLQMDILVKPFPVDCEQKMGGMQFQGNVS